jgi:hypothetical protein
MRKDQFPGTDCSNDSLDGAIHVAHEEGRMQMPELRLKESLRSDGIVHAARDQQRAQFLTPCGSMAKCGDEIFS